MKPTGRQPSRNTPSSAPYPSANSQITLRHSIVIFSVKRTKCNHQGFPMTIEETAYAG
jgi:hypothetical protein